jgi:hypothetical protein
MYNETITQRLALANAAVPATVNGAAVNTGNIDMQQSKRAFFAVVFGATVGGTVTMSLQESADGTTWSADGTADSFSGSGGSNTQLAKAPPVASKIYTFEVRADQLSAGKRYVRLNINVSANNNLLAALAWGDDGIHKPSGNSTYNGTNVSTQSVVS